MSERLPSIHAVRVGNSLAVSIIALVQLVAPCSPSPSLPAGITPARCAIVPKAREPASSIGAEGLRRNAGGVFTSSSLLCRREEGGKGQTLVNAEEHVQTDRMRLRVGSGEQVEKGAPAAPGRVRTVMGSLHQRGGTGGEGTEEMRKGLGTLFELCGFKCACGYCGECLVS